MSNVSEKDLQQNLDPILTRRQSERIVISSAASRARSLSGSKITTRRTSRWPARKSFGA